MTKATTLTVVALLALVGAASAALPTLPTACTGTGASSGCCPAHRMLLELEATGCDIEKITAGTVAEATSMCTTCGGKLGDIASVYADATGESCLLVQYTLRMFPFACELDTTSQAPCVTVVTDALATLDAATTAGTAPAPTAAEVGTVCGGGCWKKFLSHMETSDYNVAGVSTASYDDRIGGVYGSLVCLQVGQDYCLPQIAVLADLPTLPDYLYEWDGAAVDTKFCSGCNRALLSNAYGLASTDSLDKSEFARRLLLGSCPVNGGSGCRDVLDGAILKAERERLQIGLADCVDLFTAGNPVCRTQCATYLTGLVDRLGCCARYALENTAVFNAAPTGWPTPTSAYMASFLDLAASATDASLPGCGIDLRNNCVEGTTVFTASLTADWITVGNDAGEVAKLGYSARQDIARLTGALIEDVTLVDVQGNVDFRIQSATDAATNAAGDAWRSMVNGGALLMPTAVSLLNSASYTAGAAPVAEGVCRDDVIPNYHYLPEQGGTYTTDCLKLKETQPSVDCTAEHYTDGTTKFWLVTTGLLANAESCAEAAAAPAL